MEKDRLEKGNNKNGIIEFQIKNGIGNGKEYYYYGKLRIEGEYLNDKKWNCKEKIFKYILSIIKE